MAESLEPKPDLLEEHIASRKSWGRYVELASGLRRSSSSEVERFLSDLRARMMKEALKRR